MLSGLVPGAQRQSSRSDHQPLSRPQECFTVHIPFCTARCQYCYYLSYVGKTRDQIDAYLDALRQDGYRRLVLGSSEFPRYHIGESLIPSTYAAFDRLGLLPKLKASGFPAKYSVRFVSPSGTESDPFYFSETIEGDRARTWQVERSAFDQMCLDNARDWGVDVQMATHVTEVLFDNERAIGVRARRDDGEALEVRARIVADASGRATVIGSQRRCPIPRPRSPLDIF